MAPLLEKNMGKIKVNNNGGSGGGNAGSIQVTSYPENLFGINELFTATNLAGNITNADGSLVNLTSANFDFKPPIGTQLTQAGDYVAKATYEGANYYYNYKVGTARFTYTAAYNLSHDNTVLQLTETGYLTVSTGITVDIAVLGAGANDGKGYYSLHISGGRGGYFKQTNGIHILADKVSVASLGTENGAQSNLGVQDINGNWINYSSETGTAAKGGRYERYVENSPGGPGSQLYFNSNQIYVGQFGGGGGHGAGYDNSGSWKATSGGAGGGGIGRVNSYTAGVDGSTYGAGGGGGFGGNDGVSTDAGKGYQGCVWLYYPYGWQLA